MMQIYFFSHSDLNYLSAIVNNELSKVSRWLKLNKLTLNLSKTNFILFRPRQKKLPHLLEIKIDNTSIQQVSSTKFLGVIINENLTWVDHINMLYNKISKSFGILCRIRYKLHSEGLLLLYNSLIRPYFENCSVIWASNNTTHLIKLQRLQKKIIRIIYNRKWCDHTSPLFNTASLLHITDDNKLQTACFVYKALNKLLPQQFQKYFSYNCTFHSYFTRQTADIHIDYTRTSVRQYSIKYHGAILWNSLPDELKTLKTVSTFKTHYKNILLANYV